MIPLADDNPTRSKPYVVYALIAINVLVYLIDRVGAQGMFGHLYNWSMVPDAVVRNAPVVQTFPVKYGPYVRQVQVIYEGLHPMWLTVFTSMFMHGSLMHIGGNLLYLWIFGNNIEDTLGHFKFIFFYLLGGALAAGAHIVSDPQSTIPTVGASGAIAATLGAYIVLFPSQRIRTLIMLGFFWDFVEIPAILVLGVWFLMQLTGVWGTGGTIGGGVAYWAHIGGFVAGALIIYLAGGRKLTRRRRPRLEPYRQNERPYPFRPWK